MAMYSFITNKDIDVSLKKYFYDQAVADAPHIVKKAEGAAVSLMKSNLNSRYDLTLLFPVIKDYVSTTPYVIGTYVSKTDVIYKCIKAGTGQDPATANSTYWEESDPRDMLLVLLCVNITVFFILERVNQRKLSDDVIDAYNRAVNWLEDVKKLRENPDFPVIETESGIGMEVKGGSNEKIDHYW